MAAKEPGCLAKGFRIPSLFRAKPSGYLEELSGFKLNDAKVKLATVIDLPAPVRLGNLSSANARGCARDRATDFICIKFCGKLERMRE